MSQRTMILIRRMLEDREDVYLIDDGAIDVIQGFQLRRSWEVVTINPDGFSPVVKERWHYYGQAFTIKEKRLTAKGELVAALREDVTQIGRLGGWLLLVDPESPLDHIIDRLGRVPENFSDYLRRSPK